MDCPNCRGKYSSANRAPICMTSCGHTICEDCLARLPTDNCPLCKVRFDVQDRSQFPKNREILRVLEANNNEGIEMTICKISKEPEDFYCNDCAMELCEACLGNHLNHKFQRLNPVEYAIKKKLTNFKNRLQETTAGYQNYVLQLEQGKESMEARKAERLNEVNKFFDELVSQVKQVQAKAYREIGGTFTFIVTNEYKKKVNEYTSYLAGLSKLYEEVTRSQNNMASVREEHGNTPDYTQGLAASFQIFESKMSQIIEGYEQKLASSLDSTYAYDPSVNFKMLKQMVAIATKIGPEDLTPEPTTNGLSDIEAKRFLI